MEEAEKVKDQVEQDGYDVGVAKTEKALRCVGATASKCGMRPLTKLRLRPLLPLGEQRVYSILLSSEHQALPAPMLELPLKR